MSARGLFLVAALGAACTRPCKSGTLLVDLSLDSTAENADGLVVSVSLDGMTSTTPLVHIAGSNHGTIEVDFHGSYPAGHSVVITVEALAGISPIGSASRNLTLADGCSSVSLRIAAQIDGGDDSSGAVDDLAGVDLPGAADLTRQGPPDLGMNCASPDDPCQYAAASITDFDVAADASVFSIYSADNKSITGTCFAPDGTVRRAAFAVTTAPTSLQHLRVNTSRNGISLVTWAYQTQADFGGSGQTITSQLYDASCMPIGTEFTWPSGLAADYVFDAALDATGTSYLLWRVGSNLNLSIFDATGTKVGGDLLVDGSGACVGGGYGVHVAVNPGDGSGIVTCQQHEATPVRYRRFGANHAFVDAAMIDVSESSNNHSSWYESHEVGIAADGSFVIEWEDATTRQFRANFYSPSKSLLKSVNLGPTGPQYYDGFRYNHPSVELLGGNFILRSGFGKQFWLYSPAGELLGCDQSASQVLRTGGTASTFTVIGGALYRGELFFGRFKFCAPATCGDGKLDAEEECDDGNLEPYDGCNQFCKAEYCGDGIVTDQEQCDDGGGSILCSATCQLNPQPSPMAMTFTGADDFDVASDGTLIAVQLDFASGILYGTCYKPDRTLLRERFPLTATEWSAGTPLVMMSRVSKKSLVAWTDTLNVYVKLLDANCFMAHAHATAVAAASGFYDTAIDDTGRSIVAASNYADSTVRVAFFDATGAAIGSEQMLPAGAASYGIHAAMNQMSGGGIVSYQQNGTGDVVYFNRFKSDGTWVNTNFVKAGVGTPGVSYNDGHTVGMNDAGQHVLVWRDASTGYMKAAFFDATGVLTLPTVTWSSTVRSNEGTSFYNSFSRKHEKVALAGANFVLGETYNSIVNSSTNPGDKTQTYYLCTPAGVCTIQYANTLRFVDSGTNDRLDGNGVSYFLQNGTIYYATGEL